MSLSVIKADWVIKSPPESQLLNIKNWKTRVLALLLNERLQEWSLFYYKDKDMTILRGKISLSASTQLYRVLWTDKSPLHLFAVQPMVQARRYYFACPIQEQRDSWLEILSSVLQAEVSDDQVKCLPGLSSTLNKKASSLSHPTSPGAARVSPRQPKSDSLSMSPSCSIGQKSPTSPTNGTQSLPRPMSHRPLSMDIEQLSFSGSGPISPTRAKRCQTFTNQMAINTPSTFSFPNRRRGSEDSGYMGSINYAPIAGKEAVQHDTRPPLSPGSSFESADESMLGSDTLDRSSVMPWQSLLKLLEQGKTEEAQQLIERMNFSAGLVSANLEGDGLLLDVTATRQEKRQLADLQERLKAKEWSASDLKLVARIGKGCFGEVWQGNHKKTGKKVAIKLLQGDPSTKEKLDFLEEAVCMSKFDDNEHVLGLIAVHTKSNPAMIMTEFMMHGSIHSYLRDSNRTKNPLELHCQLWIALQVTVGMHYLVHTKRFVHRDLAARNVLLTVDSNGRLMAKVADFGLSRSIYYDDVYRLRRKYLPLPIKWMAKECLEYGVYTHKTDVWSFGVFLWELMSGGKVPYPGVSSEDMYIQLTEKGLKLSHPALCPDDVYELMMQCTDHEPDNRPTFAQLCHLLGEKLAKLPQADQYPIKEKLAAVDESLQSVKSTLTEPSKQSDSGYSQMFKVRRSIRRKTTNSKREAVSSTPHITINDIPCLQAVKQLDSDVLLRILDEDVGNDDERCQLQEPKNRSNMGWLQHQVETRWLRRGDQGSPSPVDGGASSEGSALY